MRKRLAPLFLALALLLSGCGEQEAPVMEKEQVGFYFDTVVTMRVYVTDEAAVPGALEECARYEALLSRTVEGSDVWNLNHAAGRWVDISPETEELLRRALEISQLTGGKFDVTIAPCVALWDFTGGAAALPDAGALAEAAALVDYAHIELESGRARLTGGASIDLGAIAKGYITDRIADYFRAWGVRSGYLNFGGNVLVIGAKPDGSPWRIGVQDPRSARGDSLGVVEVRDRAVVTSGIYERGFDLEGVRYHHLLDTATGWPIQNELASVTILAADACRADALSTAVFSLGLRDGMAMVESLNVGAVLVTREGQIHTSSALENFQPLA